MSDNKIIKFPVEKVKQTKKQNQMATKWQQSRTFKRAVPISVLSIFCLYIFMNSVLVQKTEEKSQLRTIASLGQYSEFKRDVEWEHRLALQLSMKPQQRGIASVGRSPHLRDELTAGLLHNKYRIEFTSGKIVNIELADSIGHVDPTFVDSNKFLVSYKKLMPVNYAFAKPSSKVKEQDRILETYELMDSENKVLGSVEFKLDIYGRLLAMKVLTEG
ncbi:MAG: hypothetical protein KDD58_09970 [Bdellovibrionales bacterium]|nr:hypothetical protein [Bdellovibrionales bacterium]